MITTKSGDEVISGASPIRSHLLIGSIKIGCLPYLHLGIGRSTDGAQVPHVNVEITMYFLHQCII